MVIEQYIGNYIVPTDGIESIPLSKEAYDVQSPQKRLSDYSKTIKLPETPETNKVFEHLFELNVALQTFNPNLKTTYTLIADGRPIIRGFCQLNNITITDGKIYYSITAIGVIGDLFDEIGDSELTDLDFSSMNHTWNETNIVASWTPTLGTDYVYPMISYGFRNTQEIWYVEDFKPAIFLKEYIDAIFAAAGFTYTSTFFNTTRFKSLIIPQSSDVIKLSNATIKNRQFLVSRETTDQTALGLGIAIIPSNLDVVIFNDDSTSPNYNTAGNDYSTSTGKWTVLAGQTGKFAFKGLLSFVMDYTESSTGYTASMQRYIDKFGVSGQNSVWYLEMHIVRTRNSIPKVIDSFYLDMTDGLEGETITSSYTSPTFNVPFTSADIDVQANDIYDLRVGKFVMIDYVTTNSFSAWSSDFEITVKINSTLGTVYREGFLRAGETMVMNDTIPKKIKQKDLLNSIIKRFNLYLEVDPLDDKNIIIEPAVDFFDQSQEDISDIIDISRDMVINPLGALKNGRFIFRDQEGKDEYNKQYQFVKDEVYGTQTVNIDNDFQTADKEITSIFAPTPLWAAVRENDRIISAIYFPRESGEFAKEQGKLRLLYWGGTKTTNYTWFIQSGSPTLRTTYPYAGHLDDPYNPQFDLSWGVPRMLFYDFSGGGLNDLLYTDKNCYNIYWKKYINEIIDKDSKTLEVYLALDFYRFATLSFRKSYYINGSFWRLLKVSDFDAMKPKTTKCTFIKLPEGSAFTGEQKTIYSGQDTFTAGDETPEGSAFPGQGGASGTGVGVYLGEGVQAGNQSVVNSDQVLSGTGMKQVLITGSDGGEVFGESGLLINSPGQLLYGVQESMVNSVFLEKKLVFEFDTAEMTSFATNKVYILDNIGTNEYIKITRAYARMAGSSAITGGGGLDIQTVSTNSVLASLAASFFSTVPNTGMFTLGTEVLDFGEGIQFSQSSDMGGGTGNTFTVHVYYQIIRF